MLRHLAAPRTPHVLLVALVFCVLLAGTAARAVDFEGSARAELMSVDAQDPSPARAPAPEIAAPDTATTGENAPRVAPNTPGVITGYVTDVETGVGLAYTNIVIRQVTSTGARVQAGGSIALTRGQYFARVAPGDYELSFIYLGYDTVVSEPLAVEPGATLQLDIGMKVKPIEFQAFTVQATAIRNTALSALAEKKKAVALQEAITAEEISKGTDSDAAEALSRVTGLSVVGGKFVFVRGLGDRYSSTSLNGASLSSPEPNRRTVPLDIFPAAMLDNIVVQKTYTPDMDGEFGGGNIDVQTRDAIEERSFSQRLSIGYSENVFQDGFLSYQGGRTDWLGIDDGTRGLPRIMDPYADSRLPEKRNILGNGIPTQQLSAIREAFPNVWTPRRQDSMPNFGYSSLFADRFSAFGRRGSVLIAGSLSNSANTRSWRELNIKGGSENVYSTDSLFDVDMSERSTLLGVTSAFNYRLNDASRLTYNLLYTRGSDDRARIAEGLDNQGETFLQQNLTYVERELQSHVLRGDHVLGGVGSKLQWQFAFSNASRNEPDRRLTNFQKINRPIVDPADPETPIGYEEVWGRSPIQEAFSRVFGESEEDDKGFKLNWDFRSQDRSWIERGVKLGFAYRDRDRSTRYRRFAIDCAACEYDGSGEAENLFDRSIYQNPSTLDRIVIFERSTDADVYDAGQQSAALFAMMDLDFASRLRMVGGVRFETSEQYVQSESAYVAAAERQRVETTLENQDWLPALNLTYRVSDRINLRSAYSRTLNRPEMRELSPFTNFNYEENIEEQGNLFLRQATIDSYDLRFEFYPTMRKYFAFSVFRKNIDSPIERVYDALAAGNYKEFPGNGQEGYLEGWEVEWRAGLADLAENSAQAMVTGAWLGTRPFWLVGKIPGLGFMGNLATPLHRVGEVDNPTLDQWGFTLNYSRIESEVTIDRNVLTAESKATSLRSTEVELLSDEEQLFRTPLTGQSNYALNAGIVFSDERQDFSLMVQGFGDRLEALGLGLPALIERVPLVLDSAYSRKIASQLKVKFSIENILNQRREYFYDIGDGEITGFGEGLEPIRRGWYDGRKLGISLTYAP